jgi:hypothetical protein
VASGQVVFRGARDVAQDQRHLGSVRRLAGAQNYRDRIIEKSIVGTKRSRQTTLSRGALRAVG